MSLCHQCNAQEAQLGLLCYACIAENSKNATTRAKRYVEAGLAPRFSLRTFLTEHMFKVLGVVAVLLVLLRSIGIFGYGSFPPIQPTPFATSVTDPCHGKQRCLVLYLTPWCPACRGSGGFIKGVRSYSAEHPNIGLQVAIGSGSHDQRIEFARELGGSIYLDESGEVARAMRTSAVPSWVVIDRQRKIITYGSGLYHIERDHPQFETIVRDQFKLVSTLPG